jgi:hypothetical protein
MKGEKIVAFCDRHCNVLLPMVRAAGNRHESPLFPSALSFLRKCYETNWINSFKLYHELGLGV